MNKPFLILLFLALAAYGQQERIAIIQTMDDRDSIGISELAYLTDRLRETAVNVLPKQRYGVMTTESIVAFLGSQERAAKECREASCLAELGRKVNADYVAQARIGRFEGDLTIKTELYSSKSGVMVGSFTGDSKSLQGLRAIIDEKAPILFKKLPGASGGSASFFVAGGISGLEKVAGYDFDDEKSYVVNLSTEPSGAVLSFDGMPSASCIKTPCKAELREGNVRIMAALEQYETADTTVPIKRNNQNIAITLKPNFGILEIKPAYLDGIGEDDDWDLSINDKGYRSFENRFSPGKYNVKLSHECYETVSFTAGINKNKREVFDMADNITLKKGGLALRAEQNGEPVSELVFVNGKQAGETPFSGAVPLCAEIEIGENRETVDVKLKYNEKVSYTHKFGLYSSTPMSVATPEFEKPDFKKPIKKSLWVAIALDVLGVVMLRKGYSKNEEMKEAYDEYKEIGPGKYHGDAWENVESSRSSRNAYYIIGGLALASGVVVHIWF